MLLQLPVRASADGAVGLQPRVLEPRLRDAGRAVPVPGVEAAQLPQSTEHWAGKAEHAISRDLLW